MKDYEWHSLFFTDFNHFTKRVKGLKARHARQLGYGSEFAQPDTTEDSVIPVMLWAVLVRVYCILGKKNQLRANTQERSKEGLEGVHFQWPTAISRLFPLDSSLSCFCWQPSSKCQFILFCFGSSSKPRDCARAKSELEKVYDHARDGLILDACGSIGKN